MANESSFVVADAQESIFGRKESREAEHFMPNILPLTLNKPLIKSVMDAAKRGKRWVLIFVIGTKPCFYKFYGSIVAASKAGIPYFIINSNQHYDDVLTHGLMEFDVYSRIGANLCIRGDLAQKSAEMMLKVSWLARYLKKSWHGVTVIPVVLGDTIMTSIVPAAWMFSRREKAIQVEAGLRSMAPEVMKRYKEVDKQTFIDQQFYGKWMILRNEPFPEQWDTFTSAAGSEFLFAPVELNKSHLIREGYPEKNIWVSGGVVVDAMELKMRQKPKQSIFSIYPQLENGEWIRVDIHRRDNLTPHRFKAIIGAIEMLVKKGYNINFVEMNATKMALESYGMKTAIDKLRKHRNFLCTSVWPEYSNVVEFYNSKNCLAALTDSGGLQEEMNVLGKVCMTCRFNTDRPETVNDARSNILIPAITKDFILGSVEYILKNHSLRKSMMNAKKLYGKSAGSKIIKIVQYLEKTDNRPFKWAHEALGLWKDDEAGIEYL